MTTTEIDRADTPEPEEIEPARFARPGAPKPDLTAVREDDPPPNVPRDQWDRPLIVLRDGSDVRAYIRASKFGKIIEDYYTLHKWDERNIVWGMSRGRHLVVRAQAVTAQTGKDNVNTLQDIAERAKLLAGGDVGALTGTGLHLLSERRDAGEDLSYLDPHTMLCLDAYAALLAPFEVLATEQFVISDELGSAGTFDRVLRLRFPIRWPDGVIWPAGMIVVIDVKTGKVTSMPYWGSDFTCQQLVYATGEPYDPGVTILDDPHKRSATNIVRVVDQPGDNGRIGWDAIGVPGGPSQRWAMICHVPALDPSQAHWERVDLDEARRDAEVARAAWDRNRVDRSTRFLALPAAALVPPDGITLAGTDDGIRGDGIREPVDTDESTSSESIKETQAATAERLRAQTTAALRTRIERAGSTDAIDQLYDSWGTSPAWTDELTDLCQAGYDRLTPPEDVIDCDGCNYGTHICPACGVNVAHGVHTCAACSLRIDLDEAPTLDTIEALWLAHGPAGDGLWADEHSAAAQASYDRLSPPEQAPDDEPEPEQQPETDELRDYCAHTSPACAGCAPDGDPRRPACPDDDPAVNRVSTDPGPTGSPEAPEQPEPGPFDDTTRLDELRRLIDGALDETTLIALYETHKPVAEGGDGLWDDECSDRAQAVYDRLSPPGTDPVDTPEGAPA
jgi:hypothetical protein